MLNSLLGKVNINSLILDIFIVLAVVVAGALIVYFLWEAVSSYVSKDKKKSSQKLNFEEKPEEKKEEKSKDEAVENFNLDAQPVVEEEKQEAVVSPVVEQPVEQVEAEEVDEQKAAEEQAQAKAEEEQRERENAERRAYLEARRQELIRRMQAEAEEEQEEETAEEPVEEEVVSEPVAAEEEVAPVVDNLEEERNALVAEREKYEAMVKELEEAKLALAQQQAEPVVTTVVTNGVLSLDELKARLADAEEKLKETDKEFRQCKKEYTPLHRVWVTHERDERKLRRKEALVAKQKVILYGVNNYADIDEEKAKKLAEDLDLLDGLKLSVQHCEEVMKKNAERYPLLEKMYNVLSQRNEEIRADIAYYKSEIEKLEAEQAGEGSEEQSEAPTDAE